MSVEIDPPELGFRRPFTHEVTQVLRLRNPHDEPVVYKVKTTAPKQYCVRPNSGTIEPNKEVEIQVLLQSMKEDPPLDAKCRDKFLVQSALINDDGENNVGSIIEKTPKDQIKERKIRVTFLPAHDSTPVSQHAAVNGSSAVNQRSPSPIAFGSPSQSLAGPTEFGTKSEPENEGKPSVIEAAKASVSSAAATTKDTLQQQLESANATITQLKGQIEDQGLRQRKTDAVAQDSKERITTGTTSMEAQTQPAGVPVQLVAALCLLSFLLAYFFF